VNDIFSGGAKMSDPGQEPAFGPAPPQVRSALGNGHIRAGAWVRQVPQKWTSERSLFGKQTSCTRQDCPNLRKLSELRVDFDRTTMLLDDDVMSDGEPKAGALSGRLCRKERLITVAVPPSAR
jgi:hypothetical protein